MPPKLDCPFMGAAVQLARLGGEVVMRYFQTDLQIDEKGTGNLVSQADLESERAIVQQIRHLFPDHAILAEETAADTDASQQRFLWIIDPLDGTNNYAHGIPHFAISIALYEAGQPLCGAVLDPVRNDLYAAVRGKGAYLNDQALAVSEEPYLHEALVGTGFYYDRGELMRRTLRSIERLFEQRIHGIRRFGAASLDLCHVASGRFGAYFEYELAPWDFAAGRLIVEEAGGQVTDCEGGPLPQTSSSLLASNRHLHAAMLQVISSKADQRL